jgi:hypothetical protein
LKDTQEMNEPGKSKPLSGDNDAKVGASILSALSGNHYSRDRKHNRIRHFVSGGRYARNIQAFSIENESPPKQLDPYKTTWVKSPHGAYVLVRTKLPINLGNGMIESRPGYVLMFSQHPSFLARLFLRRNKPGNVIPKGKEIEARTSVIAARYERDIIQKNRKTGRKHLITSWVRSAINSHTITFEKLLKRHGAIIRDGKNLLRSGSSIIVLKQDKNNPDLYQPIYYGNPVFGQVSLFMNEKALESGLSKVFFGMAAIKMDTPPLPWEEAYRFAHKQFADISRGIIRMKDPYHLDEVKSYWPKMRRLIHTVIVRTTQKMAYHGANINIKQLTTALGISGIFIAVAQVPALFLAANSAKSNIFFKTAQSAGRQVGKALAPVKSTSVNALNDMSVLVASQVANNVLTEEVRGLIPNSKFIRHMTAMPIDFMPNTYSDTVPYTKEHERTWAQSVLLDTLGIQPGTIFSEVEVDGQDFLLAEQPNGLDVYYNPEQRVAFASKAREPFEYSPLEKPIQLLFDEMESQHNFIGLKCGQGDIIEQQNFASLEDIPELFKSFESYSIESLRQKGMAIEDIRSSDYFPTMEILPLREANAQRRKINSILKTFGKTVCREKIYDPDHEEIRFLERKIDEIYPPKEPTILKL